MKFKHINKMAEKKHTHDPLNVDEALSNSEAFLLKYKNLLIGIVAAIIVIAGGIMAYKNFISEPNELKASETIFKGEEYFRNAEYETALNGDSLGYVGFLKITDEFSGTKAGNLANAYTGLCYAQLGKYEDATKYLDKFNADDYMVAPAILGALGLLKAADKADSDALSPIFLLQAGEILEKLGKNSEAINAYKQIKNKYATSYQALNIDKYIERASIK